MHGIVWKSARFDLSDIVPHCVFDAAGPFKKIADEPWRLPETQAKHVMQDEYLAAASDAGTDADDRNRQPVGEIFRQRGRDHLDHEQSRACGGELLGVLAELMGRALRASLYSIAAQGMHRLRSKT